MLPKSYSSFTKFGVTRSVKLLSSSRFAMSPKNCVTIFEGLLGHGFSVLINLFKYLIHVTITLRYQHICKTTLRTCSYCRQTADITMSDIWGAQPPHIHIWGGGGGGGGYSPPLPPPPPPPPLPPPLRLVQDRLYKPIFTDLISMLVYKNHSTG